MEPVTEWDIAVVGGTNTDYVVRGKALPAPGTTLKGWEFLEGAGGKGPNQAVAAARLGARTALVASVGRDRRGTSLLQGIADEGVHVAQIIVDRGAPTGAAVIHVDEDRIVHCSAAARRDPRPQGFTQDLRIVRERGAGWKCRPHDFVEHKSKDLISWVAGLNKTRRLPR